MEKPRRTIKINKKKHKFLGSGMYGKVWKISKTLVVKAFNPGLGKLLKPFVWDEVRGSKTMKLALPVKEVVTVILSNGIETIGLVKKYIPFPLTDSEFCQAEEEGELGNGWDVHSGNFRKDEKGRIWMTDTQTGSVNYIESRLYSEYYGD